MCNDRQNKKKYNKVTGPISIPQLLRCRKFQVQNSYKALFKMNMPSTNSKNTSMYDEEFVLLLENDSKTINYVFYS